MIKLNKLKKKEAHVLKSGQKRTQTQKLPTDNHHG